MAYEAPSIKAIGSVADVTLAQSGFGQDDHFLGIPYGSDSKVS
ncbi:lasso RiPP family leader peptide-containing protein [Rathayibacter sp. CAU 1779]